MRIALLSALILGLAGCDGGSTGPEAPAIIVRVVDDIGDPVDRIHVIIALAPADRIDARTRGDGTTRVAVPGAGDYEVRVIPRAGYLGTPGATSRTVTVGPGGTATADFTVHRESLAPPPRPDDWPLWIRRPANP